MITLTASTLLTTSLEDNASQPATAPVETPAQRAFKIALGDTTIEADENAHEVRGAQNDYNAKGRGSTMARRVLRNGTWEWLSAPASRGRFLASDRKDTTYGEVYEGEIVAQYTLGGDKRADKFFVVISAEKPLVEIDATKIKTGYKLELGGMRLDVSDPYWK